MTYITWAFRKTTREGATFRTLIELRLDDPDQPAHMAHWAAVSPAWVSHPHPEDYADPADVACKGMEATYVSERNNPPEAPIDGN